MCNTHSMDDDKKLTKLARTAPTAVMVESQHANSSRSKDSANPNVRYR